LEGYVALITCHECGERISSDANVCPKCGAISMRVRRGWVAILVAVIVCIAAYILIELTTPTL
jgi:RNA polymerase subunit RPABC4/transcription elongation factor Spt4